MSWRRFTSVVLSLAFAGPSLVPIVERAGRDESLRHLLINGRNFGSAPVVRLAGVPLTVVSESDAEIVVARRLAPSPPSPASYLLTLRSERRS